MKTTSRIGWLVASAVLGTAGAAPAQTNRTAEGRQKNRRVDVDVAATRTVPR